MKVKYEAPKWTHHCPRCRRNTKDKLIETWPEPHRFAVCPPCSEEFEASDLLRQTAKDTGWIIKKHPIYLDHIVDWWHWLSPLPCTMGWSELTALDGRVHENVIARIGTGVRLSAYADGGYIQISAEQPPWMDDVEYRPHLYFTLELEEPDSVDKLKDFLTTYGVGFSFAYDDKIGYRGVGAQ